MAGNKKQKSTENLLKPKQKELAKILASPDGLNTITEICKAAGVDRGSYYKWIKNPEFLAYVRELVDKHTDGQLGRVYKALFNQIDKGNIQAIELYFKLKNMYADKQVIEQTQNFKGDINVNKPKLKDIISRDKDAGSK